MIATPGGTTSSQLPAGMTPDWGPIRLVKIGVSGSPCEPAEVLAPASDSQVRRRPTGEPRNPQNQAIGAPNLTDDIWLHGWGEQAIVSMVTNGKVNQMPAQEGKLTAAQIHVLAAYVWGLSNKPILAKP